MADFWIKLEKNTPDKPEIFEMAEILSIDPDAVLGKLIRVWCWIDSNSADGHIKSVTSVLIDRLTMSQGFADAMKTVGWLCENSIPNFDRHLGESAKKRAKDSERKRKSRDSSEECHKKSVTESGLDKSRVDKIIKDNKNNKKVTLKNKLDFSIWPQIPDESKINDLIALRKSKKAALSQTVVSGLSKTMHELSDIGITVNQVLEIWCLRGWQGLKKEWVIDHVKKEASDNGQNRPRANEKQSLVSKAYSDRDRLQAAIDAHRKNESVLVMDDKAISAQMENGRGRGV